MTSKTEVTLEHFYIFNGTYAKKEGEASKKNLSTKKYLYVKKLQIFTLYVRILYTLCTITCVCMFSMQEEKKILYYYPEKDLDVQIKNIGLSEAIIKFAQYV